MKIKIYGSRGSMPFFGRDNIGYGGNTSCIQLVTGTEQIILDCGSGLAQLCADMQAEKQDFSRTDILIGHLHIDHIIGLSSFSPIWNKNNNIRIFTLSRSNLPLSAQIFGIFKPPYWPVDLEKMNLAELVEIYAGTPFTLGGGIKVTPFLSNHHDKTTAFRIDADKSIVYLLDCEADPDIVTSDPLVGFCSGADLIIFDATYLPEDYPKKKGWGHSSYEAGIKLAEASSCGMMVLSHLNQEYSDKLLDSLAAKLNGINTKFLLAYDGMELDI